MSSSETEPQHSYEASSMDHLRHHDYCLRARVSPRRKSTGGLKCPCCSSDQDKLNSSSQQSAATPQKRKCSSPSFDQPPNKLVQRTRSSISPADLPQVLDVVPNFQASYAVDSDDAVTIHNHSVEQYQQIYYQVVGDKLRDKKGSQHYYRFLKQKLWERMRCPVITTSTNEDGLVHVEVSYGAGVHPPHHHIDITGEPEP